MSRPRVFISSTYYDLKHLRSSLESFVESLGFDAILSEKGKIAYTPDLPLDESCYREVGSADIFVLIIGGRYGTEVSATKTAVPKTFYERYNSITRGEYGSAVNRDVPTYVLIERSVYAEYETYLKNKSNKAVSYAHVDSVNIFELIEHILGQPRNNPIQQFEKYSEIEIWLREQWSGLFRELLQRLQSQAQISSLQAQVAQLSELNTTLKRYLEEIVSRIAPKESEKLIKTETERLANARRLRHIRSNALADFLNRMHTIPVSNIWAAAEQAVSFEDFVNRLMASASEPNKAEQIRHDLIEKLREPAERDLNLLRETLGKQPFDLTDKPNLQRLRKKPAPQQARPSKPVRRTKKPQSN